MRGKLLNLAAIALLVGGYFALQWAAKNFEAPAETGEYPWGTLWLISCLGFFIPWVIAFFVLICRRPRWNFQFTGSLYSIVGIWSLDDSYYVSCIGFFATYAKPVG